MWPQKDLVSLEGDVAQEMKEWMKSCQQRPDGETMVTPAQIRFCSEVVPLDLTHMEGSRRTPPP